MRGRAGGGDPDFGSDSFLDIVANLVGILIVLIVLAGLRAGQAPVETAEPAPDEDSYNDKPAVTEPGEVIVSTEPFAQPEIEPVASAPAEPEPVPELPSGPSREEVQAQMADAQQRIAALRSQLSSLNATARGADLEALQRQLAARAERLKSLESELNQSNVQAALLKAQLDEVDREYEQLQIRLAEMNRRQEELQSRRRPEKQLDLRINPIGRRSTGEEISFRVENGRVVHLPVKELFQLALRRERNSMASILSGRTQLGVAGPIDGVALDYEFGMAAVPVYTGSGPAMTTRPQLGGLVKTLPSAPSETIEDAISTGGIIERHLIQAEPGTVIRLTVATDSFADGRRIAAFARDLDFAVASHPIEPGGEMFVRLAAQSDAFAQ